LFPVIFWCSSCKLCVPALKNIRQRQLVPPTSRRQHREFLGPVSAEDPTFFEVGTNTTSQGTKTTSQEEAHDYN